MAVSPSEPPRGGGSGIGRFLGISVLAGVVAAGICLPGVGSIAVGVKDATAAFDSLPTELTSQPLPQRTYIESSDGQRIATLYTENRIVVPLDHISPLLQKAVVAVEDSRFYEHRGVDVKGSARALVANSSAGGVQQGSSTITMQYVRNILISNAQTPEDINEARRRSLTRKLQEMRYAIGIEKKLTKEEILGGYLNIAYFGAGAYGAEAASHRYFGIPAAALALPQAATLAGLVQQPVGYDPTAHPTAATTRRDEVLDRMVETGAVSAADAAAAKKVPMKKLLHPQPEGNGCADSKYPFYCDFVVHQIENDPRYGSSGEERRALLRRGGMVIHTGLDTRSQNYATQAAMRMIPRNDPSRKATALAMIRPSNGVVTTLAQNRYWGTKGAGKTTYNYAVDQKDGGTIGMQAGSTFKIFTLLAAMDTSQDPSEYIEAPSSRTFYGSNWGCKGKYFGPYKVHNSTSSGTMNMFQGAAYSVNTYFVELERRAGLCHTVDIADKMGITLATGKPLLRFPSFTLGSMEISPLALASAYATVANHGVYCRPHAVTSVTDLGGHKLFTDDGNCKKVVPRDVADATAAILSRVIDGDIQGRTGANMSLGRDAAGKTGTTENNAAVWFAGFTPDLATAVWAGDPRGGFKHPMQDVTINGRYYDKVHGLSLPGPLWRDVMSYALDRVEATPFDLQAKYGLQAARSGGYTSRNPGGGSYGYGYGNGNGNGGYGPYGGYGNGNGRVLEGPTASPLMPDQPSATP